MSDIPEFHGNPNDYDFNPEFVFNLKAENAALQSKLTAERELSGALREALSIASDYLPQHWDMNSVPLNKINDALAQYTKHMEKSDERMD